MKVHLTEDKGWRGQIYLKGDREIPDELAIALGFLPNTKRIADLPEPTDQPETMGIASPDDDRVENPPRKAGVNRKRPRSQAGQG